MLGKIVPIVEGDGEITAVPVLLHKILRERGEHRYQIADPKNSHGCTNLIKSGGVERFVQYAWLEPKCSGVLIIIDGDTVDGCIVSFAKNLAKRVRALKSGRKYPVVIVVANREYESWFLASITSINGKEMSDMLLFPANANYEGDPESIRNVKSWITRQLPRGMAYKETEHQEAMTRLIDLDLARNGSRSFRRLCTAMDELLRAMAGKTFLVTPE